jgi:K+-transporting ATPase ATPase C chain
MRLVRPALVLLIGLSLLLGLAYPLVLTGLGQLLFPNQANGSLIPGSGSALIGQNFWGSRRYFWGRPSSAQPPYNPLASGPSNLAVTNPAWLKEVQLRIRELRQANPEAKGPIPMDLVTGSGSGLDPDITLAAALYQVPRVAQAWGLPQAQVRALVYAHLLPRQLGFLGEPRIDVLELNLALRALARKERGDRGP